jgi:hypothetical protein
MLLWNVWTQQEPFLEFDSQFGETSNSSALHCFSTLTDSLSSHAGIFEFIMKGSRLPIPNDAPDVLKRMISQSWDADSAQRPPFDAIRKDLEALL